MGKTTLLSGITPQVEAMSDAFLYACYALVFAILVFALILAIIGPNPESDPAILLRLNQIYERQEVILDALDIAEPQDGWGMYGRLE